MTKKVFSIAHYAYGSGSYEPLELGGIILYCAQGDLTVQLPDDLKEKIYAMLVALLPEGDTLDG